MGRQCCTSIGVPPAAMTSITAPCRAAASPSAVTCRAAARHSERKSGCEASRGSAPGPSVTGPVVMSTTWPPLDVGSLPWYKPALFAPICCGRICATSVPSMMPRATSTPVTTHLSRSDVGINARPLAALSAPARTPAELSHRSAAVAVRAASRHSRSGATGTAAPMSNARIASREGEERPESTSALAMTVAAMSYTRTEAPALTMPIRASSGIAPMASVIAALMFATSSGSAEVSTTNTVAGNRADESAAACPRTKSTTFPSAVASV